MTRAHIAIIGNYDSEYDGHVATRDAVIHAEREAGVVINTRWITPDELDDPERALAGAAGALIACRNPKHPRRLMPDVLGALTWLRKNGVPTLGIECGFQHMVVEIAREVLGRDDANSTAYDEDTRDPVVAKLFDDAGPRLRMRARPTPFEIRPGSRLAACYDGAASITESFRSAFTVNGDYIAELEAAGAAFSADGQLDTRRFAAALEWRAKPFYLGVAYLPQFGSKPATPHPLFRCLIRAATSAS